MLYKKTKHTHTHTPTHFHRQPRTHDFSLQNRGPIHSDFSQWNRGLLCENLTLNRHNEDPIYYRQWGTYPPYASLSCIALSASFKKPRTSSVFCVSLFPRWNVKCVSSFVGENKRTPPHTHTPHTHKSKLTCFTQEDSRYMKQNKKKRTGLIFFKK